VPQLGSEEAGKGSTDGQFKVSGRLEVGVARVVAEMTRKGVEARRGVGTLEDLLERAA
jgi:hypothetical protein